MPSQPLLALALSDVGHVSPRRIGNSIQNVIKAVLFDFGGVVTTSPFDAFVAYEHANDLPAGLIRRINSTNPDHNAWAALERGEVTIAEFCARFEAEALALGHRVSGHAVVDCLSGEVRPRMVSAIDRIKAADLLVACLTNNFRADSDRDPRKADARPAAAEAMAMFHYVIESSLVGVRKPESEFYRKALAIVGIDATEAVFLDDLGINLKPARAMGMTTIKVVDPDDALSELGDVLGFAVTG